MKKRTISLAAGAVAALAFALPQTASASLIYDSSVIASGQGFGTAPRDLTLSSPNNQTLESGAVDYTSTGIAFGTPILDANVHDGNGVTNASGTASLPSPLADDQKYGVPTIGSLGITSADQIGILFNATETGVEDGVNVTDVTLKFYSSTGSLLGAIDGSFNFLTSVSGNGSAGFTFRVSNDEYAYVNGLLANGPSTTLALESTIERVSGGPESFLLYNLGTGTPPVAAVPEPETYALMLAGLGAMGFMARRRRKA